MHRDPAAVLIGDDLQHRERLGCLGARAVEQTVARVEAIHRTRAVQEQKVQARREYESFQPRDVHRQSVQARAGEVEFTPAVPGEGQLVDQRGRFQERHEVIAPGVECDLVQRGPGPQRLHAEIVADPVPGVVSEAARRGQARLVRVTVARVDEARSCRDLLAVQGRLERRGRFGRRDVPPMLARDVVLEIP